MDRGEALRIPQRLEGREARVQAEIAVEIDHVRAGHGDAGPLAIVQWVAMRDDHVEPVHGAALEEADENRARKSAEGRGRPVGRISCSGKEKWIQTETEEGEPSGPHKHASRDCHSILRVPRPPAPSRALPRSLPLKLRPAERESDGQG